MRQVVRWESNCVGCAIRCVRCEKHTPTAHLYCDVCTEETNALWDRNGVQMCAKCADAHEIDTDDLEEVDYGEEW